MLGTVSAFILVGLLGVGVWLWTPDLPRAELEQRYARGPSDFVEVRGVRLHVRDDGPRSAPAVILLHGFGGSLHTWDAWAEGLADRYRVIRFDLHGTGLSAVDPEGDYTDGRSLQLLAGLMDTLGLERASLVGHSMGGRIAWRFAFEQPERLQRLVLIAPDGFESPGFEYGKSPNVPRVLELMRYTLPRSLVRINLEQAYADTEVLSSAMLERYHDLLRAPGNRSALLERMRQVKLENPIPMLRTIEQPTLLVWGKEDAFIPFTNADDYMRALPNAEMVAFDGVGHVPQEEIPARSLRYVRAFLESGEQQSVAAAGHRQPVHDLQQ